MNSSTEIKSQVISKKTVFKSSHFHVDQVVIERNNKTFTKDIIERTPAVHIIPYTKNLEIYLEWQYRDTLERVSLEVIGGKMDENDDPLTAAKRELKEETGLVAKKWKQIATVNVSVNIKQKIYIFIATDITDGEVSQDEDEIIETVKMPLETVFEKIEKGEMTDASHIAGIMFFDKLKRENKLII